MIGIGAMIGAGIFILSSAAISLSGSSAILAYLILGIISLFTGLCYIELGSTIPKAGGGYTYAEELKGGFYGFITGWFMLIGNSAANAVYAIGFVDILFNWLGNPLSGSEAILIPIFAILILIIFSMINYKGISEAGNVEVILTSTQIFVLVFIICLGISIPKEFLFPRSFPINFTNVIPTPDNFLFFIQTLGLIYISFYGFEIINNVAEEMKNPQRTIKLSIILTIIISTIVYIGIIYVIIIVTGEFQVKLIYEFTRGHGVVLSLTAETILPRLGGVLLNSAAIATVASAINATICSNSRIIYAFGKDAYFPRIFGVLHFKNRTPHYAIFIGLIFSIIFASLGVIEKVAIIADVGYLFGVTLICLCIFFLRKKQDKYEIKNKTPLYPIIPIIACGFNIAIIPIFAMLHFDMIFFTLIVIAIGIMFYILRAKGMFTSRKVKRFIKFIKRQKV